MNELWVIMAAYDDWTHVEHEYYLSHNDAIERLDELNATVCGYGVERYYLKMVKIGKKED